MKRALLHAAYLIALVASGLIFSHGTASAANGCTVTAPASFPDLVANYDIFSGLSIVKTISTPSIQVMCNGENNKTINVYVSGSPTGYTTPSLTNSAAGFTLQYTLCVPGATGGCSPTTNAWTMTNPYAFTANSGNVTVTLPSFNVYIGQQDAPVGDVTQYKGTLYFSITCNGTAC